MMSIQSRLFAALIAGWVIALSAHAQTSLVQQGPRSTPVRTVLALTSLPSVVDAPLFFKLSKVELPAGKSTNYFGPVGFVYVLSGSLTAHGDGGRVTLEEGDALLLAAGKMHSLIAAGRRSAVFVRYVLARSAELQQAAEREPAIVTELYRSPAPISHLKSGPYEFTLTRVIFPPRMAPNPPHSRSGAALYYILSGSGGLIADGKTELKKMGTLLFEPYGWVHRWSNPGDTPLALLQANISEEGVPAVIMGEPPSGPKQ